MNEKNISFSTPMVQAIRDGRKVVTRRIVKFNDSACQHMDRVEFTNGEWHWFSNDSEDAIPTESIRCPYGSVGTILRVREAAWLWCEKVPDGNTPKGRPKFRYSPIQGERPVIYVANGDGIHKPTDRFRSCVPTQRFGYRLKIPRFLPSYAVCARLRITGIRVERLQEITEEQANREGAVPDYNPMKEPSSIKNTFAIHESTYRQGFENIWKSIHGTDSWATNPWVWVIQFEPA